MVSPYLRQKQDDSFSLEHDIRKLFQVIYREQNKEEKVNEEEARIKVSELISKMAFYYEKIRNAVDYNEEHLHRKDAVLRILKRQMVIEGIVKESKSEGIASNLLVELIRAGYLPNNKVPESKIDEVAKIVEKHIKLRNMVLPRLGGISQISDQVEKVVVREKREIGAWLLGLMASEIESVLEKDKVREIVVSNMYEYLSDNIKLPSNFSDHEKDRKLQIYLSIHRNYLKFDRDMLSFLVFKYYNADWWMPKDGDIKRIADSMGALKKVVNKQLEHPLSKQLDKHIGHYTVYYQVLVDLIAEDPAGNYEKIKTKPQTFPKMVKDTFLKRYSSAKKKLWRSGIHSIIYIFITKSIFVFLLEVPAIRFFGQEVNPFSLAVNVFTPAALLFLVILFTKVSTEANNRKIVEGVSEITFSEKKRTEPIVLRKPGKRRPTVNFFFGIIYAITYFISFGAIFWALEKAGFTWISTVIFLFFLALVSFFSIRIRKSVRQMIVVQEKENFITFLVDFFSIPIISVGKWLSSRFSRLNVFVFVMDFIIETPFKVLIGIAEEWTKYVKERKENIV